MCLKRLFLVALVVAMLVITGTSVIAQTTVSQGSIQGTITDPSGAVVGGAKITITHKATGQVISTTSTNAGTFNSGGLIPGDYTLRVEAKGFRTAQQEYSVQVGVTSSGNIKLEVGDTSQVVEVQASSVQVNTEQSTVQGVITGDQIDKLPVDGRNFLDLAQLEPGVQIQDGQMFDPTKAGYSSISINGVFGRTPRIELDGVDISDETVGTTTQNVGMSSIQEFNISRSNLDLSTELTSAGAVNVTTRSGTNDIHGQAFYNFRGRDAGTAAFPGGQVGYYQRNNFGGRVGGPIIKDKLFFFIDGERMKQDGLLPLVIPAPFAQLSGGFLSPFRDSEVTGKLDWQATKDIHAFYRFTYNWNRSDANFGYNYQVYENRDNTPSDAVGVDWNKGSWSNSFRFGYLKFHNLIGDGTKGASFFNPLPTSEIFVEDLGVQLSGPNLLAPQQTFQSNKQIKYDGSKVYGSHIFRYGIGYNDINGGGFASFFGIAPLDFTVSTGCGTPGNVVTCPFLQAIIGNGQGFFTEKPNFGLPAGGQHDNRLQWYVGDSWKMKPNFTWTYGLRYNRDTGRSDSDLAAIPCSAAPAAIAPCTGSAPLMNQFGYGVDNQGTPLGDPVKQPNTQFGPQVGFAWDPTKKGKTVIRAGAGIYYENSIFNNTLFDRPAKLAKGLFFQSAILGCPSGAAPGSVSFAIPGAPGGSVTSVNGVDLATGVCGQPLSVAGPLVYDLQQEFQAAVKAQGPTANPSYVANTLQISQPEGLSAFDPNFRNARSYQFNFGMQHEIWKGGVLTADYIRNVSTRFMLTIDENHVGDARFLDTTAATAAITKTTAAAGCAGGATAAAINCAINAGDTIANFAGNGLDSGNAFGSGPAAQSGAAFGGINRNMGVGDFELPEGRSTYNALQMSYKQQVANPLPLVSSMNTIIAYTLSRFVGDGGNDQFFSAVAPDFNNPSYFTGPTSLDRTDAFKFGVTTEFAHHGPRLSVIGNFGTAHPSTVFLQEPNSAAGGIESSAGIFHSDLTGDGTNEDFLPVPGQSVGKPGQFMRSLSPTGLVNAINSWNATQAGTLTPAGQALVGAGLFTVGQLQALQAYKPYVAPSPNNPVGNGIFREVSTTLAWPIKITERFNIEPSFSAFNVFNLANFGQEFGALPYSLTPFTPGSVGNAGSVNGTSNGDTRNSVRTGTGSGVFSLGAPRQVEWGIRLNF
jgi:hypothetical protein